MAQPPFYILVARSPVANSNSSVPSNILGHPTIQYHYTDDSPLSLWPQSPNEHVLVLDFNPAVMKPPTVQSMSKDLIVSGLKVEEAPGAAAADENNPKNDRMYIIDATINETTNDITYGDRNSAQDVLAQFKRRNMVLRRALLYPGLPPVSTIYPQSCSPLESHSHSPRRA